MHAPFRTKQRWLLTALAIWSLALSAAAGPQERVPLGLDLHVPSPADNPSTPEKVALGEALFFDSVLSADRTLSCATCHVPARAFAGSTPVATGVHGRQGRRNAPALVNRAYGRFFFWDGRTTTLEAQVLLPIADPAEMGLAVEEAVARLAQDARYPARFRGVFGREVRATDLAHALAAYVRTILAGDSPVDRYLAGESAVLGEQARRGLQIFRGPGRCGRCHHGTNFTDESFHNTGVAWRDGTLLDVGRFGVTGIDDDRGAFKTPTLRQVALTAPYMHDGSLSTLADVVEFYRRGGRANPWLDPDISSLALGDSDKAALVAFLEGLTSRR